MRGTGNSQRLVRSPAYAWYTSWLDNTAVGTSGNTGRTAVTSPAVIAQVSTTAAAPNSSTSPAWRRRSCRSTWRWSTATQGAGRCWPRCTTSTSSPRSCSRSTTRRPMNLVPPSTKTLMVSTMAATPFLPLTKADVDPVTSRKTVSQTWTAVSAFAVF